MKVFLSWSGPLSQRVALAFRNWLPSVIQSLVPYVSSEDIAKGAPWSPELDKALTESRFGIICLTPDNQHSQWVNYEAGALSRSIEKPDKYVSPFLFNLTRVQLEGPLTRFQNTLNDKVEVGRLITSINDVEEEKLRLKPELLKKSYETYWPELDEALKRIASDYKPESPAPPPNELVVVQQILELVRAQQRLAATKDDLADLLGQLTAQLNMLGLSVRTSQVATLFPNTFGSPAVSGVPASSAIRIVGGPFGSGPFTEVTEPVWPWPPSTGADEKDKGQ